MYINNNKIILFLLILNKYDCTLIFPEPRAKIQMIYGIGTPVELEDTSVTLGHVIKAQYFLPVNTSQILNPEQTIYPENRKIHTRWSIYKVLEHFLKNYGGKSCVLRSICEISTYNLDKSAGFFEEILHVIFRPSTTQDKLSNANDADYLKAEEYGTQNNVDCSSIYLNCTFSLIDFLTFVL